MSVSSFINRSFIIAATVAVITTLLKTNPSMHDFEIYVQRKIIDYTREHKISEIPYLLVGDKIVKTISLNTRRFDWWVFSYYDFEFDTVVYGVVKFKTIGVFEKFIIIDADDKGIFS